MSASHAQCRDHVYRDRVVRSDGSRPAGSREVEEGPESRVLEHSTGSGRHNETTVATSPAYSPPLAPSESAWTSSPPPPRLRRRDRSQVKMTRRGTLSLAVLLSLWQRFSLSLCQRLSLSLSLSLSPCARALSPPCPSFVWQRLREPRLPAHFAGLCSGFPGHGACSIFYNLLSPSSLTPTGQGFLPHELAPPARSLRRAALGHSASTTSTPIVPGHASPSL